MNAAGTKILSHIFWTPFILAVAFLPLATINVFQVMLLVIYPLSPKFYHEVQRCFAVAVWGWWAYVQQVLLGVDVVMSGDKLVDREDSIVICNHQGMADIIYIICIALNYKTVSNIRWMVKDVLKWVPGVGWGLFLQGNIFLKRNWADDVDSIHRTFKTVLDLKLPVWMIMFPEGTRLTPAKLEANTEYAKSKGLEPTTKTLFPRPKGFIASVNGLRSHVKSVCSLTVRYPERVPSLVQAIRGDLRRLEIHIKRYPIETFPESSEELEKWLKDEFRQKEAWLNGR